MEDLVIATVVGCEIVEVGLVVRIQLEGFNSVRAVFIGDYRGNGSIEIIRRRRSGRLRRDYFQRRRDGVRLDGRGGGV